MGRVYNCYLAALAIFVNFQNIQLYNTTSCYNGGTLCENDYCKEDEVFCICPDRYYGNYCEMDYCLNATICLNGGTCIGRNSCECPKQYFGIACHIEITCITEECQNGGWCNYPNDVYCSCPFSYWGRNCQYSSTVDLCKDEDCLNGGYCSYSTDPTCTCPINYWGSLCEYKDYKDGDYNDYYDDYSDLYGLEASVITMIAVVVFGVCLLFCCCYAWLKKQEVQSGSSNHQLRPAEEHFRSLGTQHNNDPPIVLTVIGEQASGNVPAPESDLPPDYGSCVNLDNAGLPPECVPLRFGDPDEPPPVSPPPTYESYTNLRREPLVAEGGEATTEESLPPPPSYNEAVTIQEDSSLVPFNGDAYQHSTT